MNFIVQTSINEMILSKYYTHSKICWPQLFWVSVSSKSSLNLTFLVKYFNQKTPNDSLMKRFLPGKTQDKMNAFGRNQNWFLCKNLHPLKTRGCSANPIPRSRRRSTFGKKNLWKDISNKIIYITVWTSKN